MKFAMTVILALMAVGCKSDQDLRSMMQEEIAKASAKTFYSSPDVIGPYSPAVRVGPMLFVSAQMGLNAESGELAGTEIESQTRQAMANLMAVLGRAGFDSSDVVQCTVYLKDMKDFQKMNLIYGGFFGEDKYPARATIEVSNLSKDARVEISAIAYKTK